MENIVRKKTLYPIYIPSKNRSDNITTTRLLDQMKISYTVVVELSEYELYRNITDQEILVLPQCDRGLFYARNFILRDANKKGFQRCWQLDDNITQFYRLNRNRAYKSFAIGMFLAVENFADRYENIVTAGFSSRTFLMSKSRSQPFRFWCTASCYLVSTDDAVFFQDKPYEDIDLFIRMTIQRRCSVVFDCFAYSKRSMSGGNKPLYKKYKNQKEMLVRTTEEYKAYGHTRNCGRDRAYFFFDKNKVRLELLFKQNPNVVFKNEEYGMVLVEDKRGKI